ncbi:MAG: type I DNA topoisomerase, partial [Peptococcaceae bacterium]|nr:type I DNA topoisomerase [Peptococcaceae bacterium]
MGKTLVIVESPSKAKTIEKFLGKNKYEVLASVGHVRDLPKSQLGIDVENDFAMKYITIRGKGDKIKELKKAASKADAVLLAPDPDREGEAIAWHLMETLKIDPDACCRIEFNEITKDAVKNAVKHPRQVAMNRVNSQQARRVLDRFIGYQLSPLLWRKVKKGLSAGRVQSVAVRIICEREEEINSFIPEEYWTLDNEFAAEQGKLVAKLTKIDGKKAEIHSEAEMQAVLDALDGAAYTVADVKVQKKTKNPAAPFITSTLQQDAYRKLNFVAKRTMRTAQQLYEGVSLGKAGTLGLITYMRTDSTRISDVAKADAAAFIKEHYGEQYLPKVQKEYKNKNNAQNAHEAIRPTYVDKTPESVKAYLTPDQYKLYKLIWERFVASQMASAQLEQTSVLIGSGKYEFTANGT